MADWINSLVIPILKVCIYLATFIFIVWLLTRFLFRQVTKNLIFFIKYSVFRKQISEETAEWCINAIKKNWTYYDVKKFLLIKNVNMNDINETLYIFHKLEKQLLKEGYEPEPAGFDKNALPKFN